MNVTNTTKFMLVIKIDYFGITYIFKGGLIYRGAYKIFLSTKGLLERRAYLRGASKRNCGR